jgi:RNA recognition motif-containing protein
VYLGNLTFGHPVYGSTTEEQLYDLFGRCGDVKKVTMGLDRNTREPCGFAFVEFFSRSAAMYAVHYLSGSKLDDQPVRIEIDRGHLEQEPDRKFGRSRSGGQVRDEINRDRGIINLRRLNQADAVLVSPRLQQQQLLPPPSSAGEEDTKMQEDTAAAATAASSADAPPAAAAAAADASGAGTAEPHASGAGTAAETNT